LAAPKKKLSVLKRARQAEKRNIRNRSVISKIKTLRKKVLDAIQGKDKDKVREALREAIKAIDSARLKGVLHRNTASRNVSRLSKKADAALKGEAA